MFKRIGFCCKKIDNMTQVNGVNANDACKVFNTRTTTVAWLNRQIRSVAEDRLWSLIRHNIESIQLLVEYVGAGNPNLRMVRLSSDLLPVATVISDWQYFYQQPDVVSYLEQHFGIVGALARSTDVRLSFHSGQFLVLSSDNPNIVDRSIQEFEYHAMMARMMGFGQTFQDFKINVHIAGRQGPNGIRLAYNRLSPEARNCITVENEENTWGLDDCLKLSDIVPTVLDLHHYWCREGAYITVDDIRLIRLLDSWRGVRPVLHLSQSRDDYILEHNVNTCPNFNALLRCGYKKSKLRAHSDLLWNNAINDYSLTFLDNFDIQVEAKAKNLASKELYNYAVSQGILHV